MSSSSSSIRRLGLIGAGQMGSGIAHVAAQAGLDVILHDAYPEALARATATIAKNMQREVKRGKLTPDAAQKAQARIRNTPNLPDLAEAELIIEAASEDTALKLELLARLAPHLRPETLLASNTSSISITRLAAATPNPEQMIGIHFFNPVPMMALVELIPALTTADQTYQTAESFVRQLNKTPVRAKDAPGFIVNRILVPMLNEAIFAVHEGLGSVEDIDQGLLLGARHPMGPLTLADYIGLDVCLAVMRVLQTELGEPKYRPCPLLVKLVEAGWLGVKTKRGFYDYTASPPNPTC